MKKISNRNSIIIIGIISGITFGSILGLTTIALIYTLIDEMTQLIVFLSITTLSSILFSYHMTKGLLKTDQKEYIIQGQVLHYKDQKQDFKIHKSEIYSIVYRPLSFGYELTFYLNDDTTKTTQVIREKTIIKIGKSLDISVNRLGKSRKEQIKDYRRETKESFKLFIKKEWPKIIGSMVGLMITVISFVLYIQIINMNLVKMILIVVSICYGIFQLYILYFKTLEKDLLSRFILCVLAAFAFIAITFVVITLFSILLLELPYTNDFFFYSVFLLPSFVVVLVLIMLLITGISYA